MPFSISSLFLFFSRFLSGREDGCPPGPHDNVWLYQVVSQPAARMFASSSLKRDTMSSVLVASATDSSGVMVPAGPVGPVGPATPGQSLVLYDVEYVLGGGTILGTKA